MNVIRHYFQSSDFVLVMVADIVNQLFQIGFYLACKDLVAVLGAPNKMIINVILTMTGGICFQCIISPFKRLPIRLY